MRLLLFCLLLVTSTVYAQETPQPVPDMPSPRSEVENKVFERVETEARFKGDFEEFIKRNVAYPKKAKRKKITGKVIVSFVIDREGNVSDVHIEAVSSDKAKIFSNEAIRLVRLTSGKWKSAVQNGVPVRSYNHRTISFSVK